MNVTDRDVLEVIRSSYDELFPAERKAADYVLENTPEAVNLNVAALASASGVSDATIIRLSHHLGYSGYYQFRLALSRDMGRMQSQEDPDEEGAEETGQDVLRPIIDRYVASIEAVGRGLDADTLLDCVTLMRNAVTVHIIAQGNTANISAYMGFRLERLGIRCTSAQIPEYFVNHISMAQEGDIVLAISKSGASRRILDALALAGEKHLRTIVISADPRSPAAAMADYVLDSSGGVPLNLEERRKGFSYLNEFLTAETLIDFVANEKRIRKDQAERLEWLLAENKL